MCALVTSDLHGNWKKAKAFSNYRRGENIEKICLGDFFDSYVATNEEIISTFKLCVDDNMTLTIGNHSLPYLNNAHNYFRCSGNRFAPELFHCMQTYKHLFHGSLIRDGYLLVHGGLSKKHGKKFKTIEEANDWINGEWNWYRDQPVAPETLSSLFDIGSLRGGWQDVSGPLWASIGYDEFDPRFNQVVGHTCKATPIKLEIGKKDRRRYHVGVDSPKYICFNTETSEFEDFIPDEYKGNDQMRKIIERQF